MLGLLCKVTFTDVAGDYIEMQSMRRSCEHMSCIQVRQNGQKGPWRQILSLKDSWWTGQDNQKELSVAAAKAFYMHVCRWRQASNCVWVAVIVLVLSSMQTLLVFGTCSERCCQEILVAIRVMWAIW